MSRRHLPYFVSCLAFAGCCLVAGSALATAPQLGNILPRGGQRGTEVEVTLNGQRLDDAQELMIYEPGVEVAGFEIVNDKQVKAKLKIATDCVLGTKHIRVRTNTGVSEMHTFRVGALPGVPEVEPNSEFIKPQPVPMNCTVEGTITNEDVDYFVVEAKKGDRVTAEVEAIRLGDSFFDVYVAILNEERFEMSTSDDAALVYQDGIASIVAPADGKYIVQIRETSYGAGNQYRCHIGTFPRPRAIVPAGGRPGQSIPVKFYGDIAGEMAGTITTPADRPEEFAAFAEDAQGISPSGFVFRVSDLDNVIEQEPNDTVAEATKGPAPAAFNGILQTPKDQDLFGFTATKGQAFEIRVHARELRSELDPVLTIYNSKGGTIAANDDSGGPDSYLRFSVPADGEYALGVRDHLGRGGNAFHYRVEVTPVAPVLQLSVNEFVQYVEPKLSVPQGNRTPLLVTATRRDFGGPLEFSGENLPPGVTIESYTLAPGQAVAQLLLVAAPDAPVGGKLGQILGKLNDPAQPAAIIGGRTKQDCVMVRGQNQRPFFVEPIPALAVAVTQAVPYSLQIVEPKAPLVKSGSMKLKVVATRAEGFTAPIKIEVLLNPAGMNSSREVSIAEGQTEAFIDCNAAGNAEVGAHKISVRGESTVGNGRVMVASPFVTLNITDPFVKLTFLKGAVEQGAETEFVANMEVDKAFEGNAQVQLLGLPNKVATTPIEINKETKELVFKLKAEADAAVTTSKSLFCQIVITEQGEPVTHNIGNGILRVDQPLPKKPETPVAAATPAAALPTPPAGQPVKRLTRLEQLRLEQKQRLEAQNAPAGEAKPAGGN